VSLANGARLGPYEIVGPLGAGGMGEVYRARDTRLGREVAIKVLPTSLASDAEHLRRFEQEARAVAALNHANILVVHDVGTFNGAPYLVTELLEGESLRERLKVGALSGREVLDLGAQIARGLAAAHDKGIVHRDLKPENVFICADGRAKILDFGLAKLLTNRGADSDRTLTTPPEEGTTPGTVMGTSGYMSPEQVRGLAVDYRSDIFSFGAVLYEMATGRRAFRRETAADTMSAILREEPPPLSQAGHFLPPALDGIVQHCLEKNPERRFHSAHDIAFALQQPADTSAASRPVVPEAPPANRAHVVVVVLGAAGLAIVAATAVWLGHRYTRERKALASIPEITRLVEAEDYPKAAALAKQARAVLPDDPTLAQLWQRSTAEVTLDTTPAGAQVSARPYRSPTDAWEVVGTTPIAKIRMPNDLFVWRIAKPGFAATEFIAHPQMWFIAGPHGTKVRLRPEREVPPEMVPVLGGEATLGSPFQFAAPPVTLDDYLIDRHEVTNGEFKRFVAAGGYERREFWKQPFVRGGRTLSWEDAVSSFRDTTGRRGPATWEAGSFPNGSENHPVAGVSWFEAAAYAEFAGKTLPTAYHWTLAAEMDLAAVIAPGSNFRRQGTQSVGSPGTLSGFGTTDMAGNVKEWCFNETTGGKRFILGGGYDDEPYMFVQTDAQSPWERGPQFGFRCMRLLTTPSQAAFGKLERVPREPASEKPASAEVFSVLKSIYYYDRSPLNSRSERSEPGNDWSCERVSFDAAYGGEREPGFLVLPARAKPPYQVVVYFPGAWALLEDKFDTASLDGLDFVVKSGRALLIPVYKGTYSRRDGLKLGGPETNPPAVWRDHMVWWSKDLGRSIDYIETRTDLDHTKVAFAGLSLGASVAPIFLAVEPRLIAAVLLAGGLQGRSALPEAEPINFLPHVRTPTLMMGGRLDDRFPIQSSQLPFFSLLGSAEKEKKLLLYDCGHAELPRNEMIRETLDWLDKYLGPVKR